MVSPILKKYVAENLPIVTDEVKEIARNFGFTGVDTFEWKSRQDFSMYHAVSFYIVAEPIEIFFRRGGDQREKWDEAEVRLIGASGRGDVFTNKDKFAKFIQQVVDGTAVYHQPIKRN